MKSFVKKLSTLLAIALISASFVVFPKPIKVEAAPTTTTWTSNYAYGSYYTIQSPLITISSAVRLLIWDINSLAYQKVYPYITSFLDSGVRFYNSSDVLVGDITFKELLPTIDNTPPNQQVSLEKTWVFDLDAFNIPSTAYKMRMQFAYSDSVAPVLSNFNIVYDLDPSSVLVTANYWYNDQIISQDVFYITPDLSLIPDTDTDIFVYWSLNDGTEVLGYMEFPIDSPYVLDGILNLYAHTVQEITILFYDGFDLVDTYSFGYFDSWQYYPDESDAPVVTRSGYIFTGWKTRLNEYYEFGRLPTNEELLLGTDFPLYATFVLEGPDGDPLDPNTPAAIESLATWLSSFGWYNYEALMFLLFVFLVGINGFLAWKLQPPAFVYMVVSLVITVIFMFMNLIPLYVTYPLVLLLITGLIVSLKEGATA